jgi:glycosyltransferase involved in cell wall biosynthesis
MAISVVMNVKNGADTLGWALDSVRGWVDEIVVADMASSDSTRTVALERGCRVIEVPDYGYVEPARAAAVAAASFEWILLLDADELVPAPLARQLLALAGDADVDAVEIGFTNFILGRRMRATGWGPKQQRHIRFFRSSCMTFGEDIHRPPSLHRGATVIKLEPTAELSINHFNYTDSSQFLEKLNRYTDVEAAHKKSADDQVRLWRVVASALREFIQRFVLQGGFRDGWRGLYLSYLMATYRIVARAKQLELERNGDRDHVLDVYQREATRLLDAYRS